MTTQISNLPPLGSSPTEIERRRQALTIDRIMNSCWRPEADEYRKLMFANLRNLLTGRTDLSSNIMLKITNELSHLYDEVPAVSNSIDPDGVLPLLEAIENRGLWQLQQRTQRFTLAHKEMIVRPNLGDNGWVFRTISPDMVQATSAPDNPSQPNYIEEARVRVLGGQEQWTLDIADISNPSYPVFKVCLVLEDGTRQDITETLYGKDMSGENYPWRMQDGTPVAPYIFYHAEETGMLWSPPSIEVIEGTLKMAALWTFWLHCVKDASWPQRYIGNGYVAGTNDTGEGGTMRSEVTVDPQTVCQVEQGDGEAAMIVGQWQAGSDPKELGEAIYHQELRMITFYGLSGSDFQSDGNAESGYAISLKTEAQRAEQRKYAPVFRRSDEMLMSLCAIISNSQTETNYPEVGYNVAYRSLPLSLAERKSVREDIVERIAQGTANKIDLYLIDNPGLSRDEAIKAIKEIQHESFLLNPQNLGGEI